MSHLDSLINKKLRKVTHELDHTITLGDSNESIDLHLQLIFDDYILNIYNVHKLINVDRAHQLVGCELNRIENKESEITLWFNKKGVTVYLSDDAYTGPEAMSLYGPNNEIVVWN